MLIAHETKRFLYKNIRYYDEPLEDYKYFLNLLDIDIND